MKYTEYEILSSIDEIDSCVQEASLGILEATIKEYDKFSQYSEFTVFEEAYIMEGKILDEATGKNTFDSFIKKVVLFIPRLLAAIVKSIASVFTDKYDDEIEANGKKASENLNKETDPNKLALAQENTKILSEGKAEFDPKTKKFKLTGKFAHLKNYLKILTGAGPILRKIRTIKDGGKTSYHQLAKEIKACINGESSIQEMMGMSLDSMMELAKDSNRVARALQGIVDEISMGLEKKIAADLQKGKDVSEMAGVKDLMDEISQISGMVHTATLYGRFAGFLGKDMGGGSFFLRKLRSKFAYDKEEDVELMNEKTKEQELKTRINAEKKQIADAKEDQKRLARKDKEIKKAQAKNAKLEKKLQDKQLERGMEKESVQDFRDERHGEPKKRGRFARSSNDYIGGGIPDDYFKDSAEIEVNDNEEIIDEDFGDHVNHDHDNVEDEKYSSSLKDSLTGEGPITKKESNFFDKFDKALGIKDFSEE